MKKLICGNWKMNCTLDMLDSFSKNKHITESPHADILIALPFIYLPEWKRYFQNYIIPCSQDVSEFIEGPITGDVSAKMLKDMEIRYSIVGHSERYKNHDETCEKVNIKLRNLKEYGVEPILCIGEPSHSRESKKHIEFLEDQIGRCLKDISHSTINIAYEPIWSIGTGKIPEEDQIEEVLTLIKRIMIQHNISGRILYGGSVKPKNAKILSKISGLDGFLIGNASLEYEDFKEIINTLLENIVA